MKTLSKKSTVRSSHATRPATMERLEGRELMSASISGNVFNDLNVAGVYKSGDPELSHVRVYVDTANLGFYKSSDPSALTDVHGNYTITGLTAGTKTVRQVVPTDFRQSAPNNGAAQMVNLANSSSHAQNVSFGDTQKGRVSGLVYNDTNKDGMRESGEAYLGNVTMFLDVNGTGVYQSNDPTTKTNAAGYYVFGDLPINENYSVGVILAGSKAGAYSGWVRSGPEIDADYDAFLTEGQTLDNADFGIHAPAKLTYGSVFSEVTAVADQVSQDYSSVSTGTFLKAANATDTFTSDAASAGLESMIYNGGVYASGTLTGSGANHNFQALSDVDVDFTLGAATSFHLSYDIGGSGFFLAIKNVATNQTVIGPDQANPAHIKSSYSGSLNGTLAAGKYELQFVNNNQGGQPLNTTSFDMLLNL